jgi:hypothetical protein
MLPIATAMNTAGLAIRLWAQRSCCDSLQSYGFRGGLRTRTGVHVQLSVALRCGNGNTQIARPAAHMRVLLPQWLQVFQR